MSSQADRQDFKWRPNDNSSTTLTRYSQEAELWQKSFLSAQSKHKKASLGETLGVIGLVLGLIGSLITLAVLSLVTFIKWVRS
ncbi:hypothetical protein [Psychroserpens luteus]|uniref:Uncharacterized protein n=1 Tax=Psychroserpens luteus TaxID=1434066 RepID=A0ABW5ZV03_9FLAO|nr:hypothetical protein [Psychroserpens luteus]